MLALLELAGETLSAAVSAPIMRPTDGSFIAIQTQYPRYSAGDLLQGYVVLQNNSPRQIDSVVVMVSLQERTAWEEEIVYQRQSGEGQNIKRWQEYDYRLHRGQRTLFAERIDVSQLRVQLAPGAFSYPFTFQLSPNMPGTASFASSTPARNPMRHGMPLTTSADVSFVMQAYVDVAGAFSADMSSTQMLTVSPYLNTAALQPQAGAKQGTVWVCCCIPRGLVGLTAAFDRIAYTAGETAGIKAEIRNEAATDVTNMDVELVRTITLRDNSGQSKTLVDVMCKQL
jgi:hypothetical protein